MQLLLVVLAAQFGLLFAHALRRRARDQVLRLPAAVRKSLEAEAKGAKIETVTKETNDDEPDGLLGRGQARRPTVRDRRPRRRHAQRAEPGRRRRRKSPSTAARPPFRRPFAARRSARRSTAVGKDMKYGVTIYETVVEHKGKSYEIVVAEDGTLVEKVLVIVDEEVTLDAVPRRGADHVARARQGRADRRYHSVQRDRPSHLRGRGQDQGQDLPDRGRRERALDFQVARSCRRMIAAAQRIDRATLSSWIACMMCPRAGRAPWCNPPGCRAAC